MSLGIGRPRRRDGVGSDSSTRKAFALAGAFAFIAVVWAVRVALFGGGWWGPIHAFVAGTVLLAISGASQLFTITWSAAPSPTARLTATQRWLTTLGVTAALVGVPAGVRSLTLGGAVAVLLGLAALGYSLVSTIRRSLLGRLDLSARFYLLGLSVGAIGVALGGLLGSGVLADPSSWIRVVHGRANVVGLVGFTITGTLPTLLPTMVGRQAVSGLEAVVGWRLAVAAAALLTLGAALDVRAAAGGVLLAGAAMSIILGGIVMRLRAEVRRLTLPVVHVVLGCVWLIVWTGLDGIRLMSGPAPAVFDSITSAAIVAGVGQVLVGSLGYLLPVLLGRSTGTDSDNDLISRSGMVSVAAANLAGLFIVAGWEGPLAVAGATWVFGSVRRLVEVWRTSRRFRVG